MRYSLAFIAGLMFLAACNKKESTPSREEEMRGAQWNLSVYSQKFDPFLGKDTTFNMFLLLPGCAQRVNFKFQENRWAAQVNLTKCDNSIPDEYSFRWELDPNDEKIHIWDAANTVFAREFIQSELINFTPTRFEISFVDYAPSPVEPTELDTLTYRVVFTR